MRKMILKRYRHLELIIRYDGLKKIAKTKKKHLRGVKVKMTWTKEKIQKKLILSRKFSAKHQSSIWLFKFREDSQIMIYFTVYRAKNYIPGPMVQRLVSALVEEHVPSSSGGVAKKSE